MDVLGLGNDVMIEIALPKAVMGDLVVGDRLEERGPRCDALRRIPRLHGEPAEEVRPRPGGWVERRF